MRGRVERGSPFHSLFIQHPAGFGGFYLYIFGDNLSVMCAFVYVFMCFFLDLSDSGDEVCVFSSNFAGEWELFQLFCRVSRARGKDTIFRSSFDRLARCELRTNYWCYSTLPLRSTALRETNKYEYETHGERMRDGERHIRRLSFYSPSSRQVVSRAVLSR